MNLAKISANGKITVPIEIRKSSAQVIYKAQAAFKGVAEEMGIYNGDEVQSLVNEVRYGKEKFFLESV